MSDERGNEQEGGSSPDDTPEKGNPERVLEGSSEVMILEERLQDVVAFHARERAQLAEQVSQLQEENDRLKQELTEAKTISKAPETRMSGRSSERSLGLDFSLPEDRVKG